MDYIGRFAPSPTGPLHAGSLLAALASWLDARAHGGQWLVRIEDVDRPRCVAGTGRLILQQLQDCGLDPDTPPVMQSQRSALYQQALDRLIAQGLAYPCRCSRRDIENAMRSQGRTPTRHTELIYPGTCRATTSFHSQVIPVVVAQPCRAKALSAASRLDRNDLKMESQDHDAAPAAPAWRLRTDRTAAAIHWNDRRLGPQQQDVQCTVGDFVLKRADGCFSYQLAVVVDDAAQGISDVVRGEDLTDNTARQIMLQRYLGLPTPRYLHTPLLLGANGEKLSKQNGAQAINTSDPLAALNGAAAVLGLPQQSGTLREALQAWVACWASLQSSP